MRVIVPMLLTAVSCGCVGTVGPASTNCSSDTFSSLGERVEFLQRYVTFRRNYTDLNFHILYSDNGRGVPGPSDWDLRLVATVPQENLKEWVPADIATQSTAEISWLADVPNSHEAAGITEWYTGPRLIVGIDRSRCIVAYRRWKH